MEIISLLDNTTNQRSKSRTKDWVKINGESSKTHNKNSQIKFETTVFKLNLCDNCDSYMLIQLTITVA